MKAWWQQLNTREQQLVLGMSIVVLIFVFYNAVWQPLNTGLADAEKKLTRQQQLLSWVQENTALYQQAKKSVGKSSYSGSISSVANSSALKTNHFFITFLYTEVLNCTTHYL